MQANLSLSNRDKVKFPQTKLFSLKDLQELLDGFDSDSKPSGQGFIDYLATKIYEERYE